MENENIEEIRVEEEYQCECIECGHTMKSSEHCKDIKCPECGGEMRRKERPGVGRSINNNNIIITKNERKLDIGTFRFIESEDGKNLYGRGYASVESWDGKLIKDEHETIIKSVSARNAMTKAMDLFLDSGSMLFNHDHEQIVGHPTAYKIDDIGIFIEFVCKKPVTEQDISNYNMIRDKDVKGLSIRFGNDFEVLTELIDGEKVIALLIHRIIEISVTPIQSNSLSYITETFMRSCISNTTETNKPKNEETNKMEPKERIIDMNAITDMNEYKDYLRMKAKADAEDLRMAAITEELATAKKKIELDALTMEGMVEAGKFEEVTARTVELTKQIEDLEAEKIELTRTITENKTERDLTLNFSEKIAKSMKETRDINGTLDPVNLVLNEFERNCLDRNEYNQDGSFKQFRGTNYGYYRHAAEYIFDQTAKGIKKVPFNPRMLAEKFLSDNNVEYDVKEFHKRSMSTIRTITTSTGIMKQSDIDYNPIVMDSLPIPLYKIVPQEPLNATTFTWEQRIAYNEADFDAETATVTAGDPTFGAKTSTCKYLFVGGKISDPAERFSAISALALDLQSNRYSMKKTMDWALMHGNSDADAYAFDGLRKQTEANTLQVYDLTGAVMVVGDFNKIDERFMSLAEYEDESGIMAHYHFVDTKTYRKIKDLFLALHSSGGSQQADIVVGGVKFVALQYNGVWIVRDPSLVDYSTAAMTASAAALAGGSLADDTYYLTIAAVTKSGECVGCTEVNATTSGSDNSVRITATMLETYRYVRVYWSESSGFANMTLIQTVENTTGAGAQTIDITAEPTSKFSQPIAADLKEGRIVSFKVGGMDGLVLKVAALEEYVEKGTTSNAREYFLRTYATTKFGNEKIILETEVKTLT